MLNVRTAFRNADSTHELSETVTAAMVLSLPSRWGGDGQGDTELSTWST